MIPAGIQLLGKLTIEKPTPYDLGLMFDSFKAISLKPYFGAQRARGCGEVNGTVNFRTENDEGLASVQFGGFKPAVILVTDLGKSFFDSGAVSS